MRQARWQSACLACGRPSYSRRVSKVVAKRAGVLAGLAAIGAGLAFWSAMRDEDRPTPIPLPEPSPDVLRGRDAVVAYARGEIGQQDPAKYWGDVLPGTTGGYPPHWCGGFTLWALHQAGLAKTINWKIGKGYCYQLPITRNPQPGDMAYFDQPYQHHAVVVDVSGDTLTTVDGNQPGQTVRERTRSIAATKPVFYSIAPLLDGTLV